MGSRKEEERNEKVIRGLMKLPPNRRCINCNSLGPQYVCTNFWTFVCITCSGIHREFTHRVKSVSMSTFTSQEVEALENGGNQRARETYLKDWSLQRQRLPDSSNVDKTREFIRNVYVNRQYAGGKSSEKPPRDMQNTNIHEDGMRRSSSYHSYSQSPPYDNQYEDRRYGKSGAVFTRKPGSDRGRYEGKMSSFNYSPGRLSDQGYADGFNEGSVSGLSDFSVSSGGDPLRSGAQSPNYQKDAGFNSPPFHTTRDILSEDIQSQGGGTYLEANVNRNGHEFPCARRTASSGSFGSIDSNSASLKSYNSGGVADLVPEPLPGAGMHQDKTIPGNSAGVDLVAQPVEAKSVSCAASSVDLFQLPAALPPSTMNLVQPSLTSAAYQYSETCPPVPLDLFPEIAPQQSSATLEKIPSESVTGQNQGWATFDAVQTTSSVVAENPNPEKGPPKEEGFIGKFGPFASLDSSIQMESSQNSNNHGPASTMYSQWHDVLHNVEASIIANTTSTWNAFEDATGNLSLGPIKQGSSEPQIMKENLSSTADRFLWLEVPEEPSEDRSQNAALNDVSDGPTVSSHAVMEPSYTPWLPTMGATQPHATKYKSTNPFDFLDDSESVQSNVFLEMSSSQDALPSPPLPTTYLGVSQPWFPQNTAIPYIADAGQGGLTYMAGQAPGSQIPNVAAQGSVASIGGNPFA